MEKSRAIELLEHLAWDRDIERNPYGDALNMAIKALNAQLSQEGTTSDLISRHDALDIFDDYNISVENGELEAYSRDRKRLCELPAAHPEPSIPLSWIEKYIEWLKSFDNEFVNLAAAHISVMVKKWRDEQNERTD